jgi:hypothetical protein
MDSIKKVDSHKAVEKPEEKWELYYWTRIKEDGKNYMIGRGEFVRLMFELAEEPYIEVGA